MTPKQARFIEEYLVDLTGSAAAIRAGYSAKHADVQGSQLLARPEIAEAIDQAKAQRSKQTGIDAGWLLKRLVAEAEADLRDIYADDDGRTLKPLHEWPLIWRQGLVQGLRWTKYGPEVKLSDRVQRLAMIGKHIGVNAFTENVKVSGLGDLAARLERARAALADEDDEPAFSLPAGPSVTLASRMETVSEATPEPPREVGDRSPRPPSKPEPVLPPSAPARTPYRPLLPRAQSAVPAGYTMAGNDWPDFVQGVDYDPTDGLID